MRFTNEIELDPLDIAHDFGRTLSDKTCKDIIFEIDSAKCDADFSRSVVLSLLETEISELDADCLPEDKKDLEKFVLDLSSKLEALKGFLSLSTQAEMF